MRCKEIVKGEASYLCGDNLSLYACETCNETTKECQNCIAIPLPSKPKKQYSGIGYGEYSGLGLDTVLSFVKDKKFLVGFGLGIVAGMFLFKK